MFRGRSVKLFYSRHLELTSPAIYIKLAEMKRPESDLRAKTQEKNDIETMKLTNPILVVAIAYLVLSFASRTRSAQSESVRTNSNSSKFEDSQIIFRVANFRLLIATLADSSFKDPRPDRLILALQSLSREISY